MKTLPSTKAIPRFEELPPVQRDDEYQRCLPFFEAEQDRFRGCKIYDRITDVQRALTHPSGELVVVPESTPLFGITKAIRDRRSLLDTVIYPGGQVDEVEGSLPVLHRGAYQALLDFCSHQKEVAHNSGFYSMLYEAGLSDFYPSVTSLGRVTIYQQRIAMDGQLAAGGKLNSVHTMMRAFDIGHSCFYGMFEDGREQPINRDSHLDKLLFLRSAYNDTTERALARMAAKGRLEYIEELPKGWGVFHVSVNP